MTDDDVVEAMARGMFMRGWGVSGGISEEELFALRKKTDRAVWKMHMDNARAAIRAVTERGGLVVAKMPGEWSPVSGDDGTWTTVERAKANLRVTGWNAALAEVRAAAVEVKP